MDNNKNITAVADCGPVVVQNARVDVHDTRYGDTASVFCNEGYLLTGNYVIECLEDGSWSGFPVCEQIGGEIHFSINPVYSQS